MSQMRVVGGLSLVLSVSVLAACGGSSSPAQPTPAATATPVPQVTPKPPTLALSVVPPCALPASNPGASASCTKPQKRLEQEVNAAIDRVITERPDLFNLNDVDGGPRILNYDAYMTAVVAALGEASVCGKVDAEGEIGAKTSNSFSEQWIIASRAGWNPPSGNWVQRKYVGACAPSTF
jgi:hypothetical protein